MSERNRGGALWSVVWGNKEDLEPWVKEKITNLPTVPPCSSPANEWRRWEIIMTSRYINILYNVNFLLALAYVRSYNKLTVGRYHFENLGSDSLVIEVVNQQYISAIANISSYQLRRHRYPACQRLLNLIYRRTSKSHSLNSRIRVLLNWIWPCRTIPNSSIENIRWYTCTCANRLSRKYTVRLTHFWTANPRTYWFIFALA